VLACACGEEVKVVDVATGAVLHTLAGDSETITAIAVSPDCKTLVAASRSLAIRVYDLVTGELRRSWRPHKAPVADLAVDASGGYVASASADRQVKVWDLQAGFCTHSFVGHSGVVLRVLFHPKQLQLYSGSDDGEVRVWDLVDKSCVAVLKAHFSAITSLALSTDGWVLLSGGRDRVVVAWDLRKNTKLSTIPVFECVEGVATIPLGSPFPGVPLPTDPSMMAHKGASKPIFFATAGEKGRLKLWRTDTGACVFEHAGLGHGATGGLVGAAPDQPSTPAAGGAGGGAAREYTDLVLLPGATGLLATTADARLLFYRPDEARKGLVLSKQLVGNVDEVTDVRLVGGVKRTSPTHIAVATNCEVIQLFELSSLSCTASCEGHRDTVLALDVAWGVGPNGSGVLVSGAKDNEVRVWSVPEGRCLAIGVGHVGSVGAVAVARKQPGKFCVSAGADKLLKVWDLAGALTASERSMGDTPVAEVEPAKKKSKTASEPAAAPLVKGQPVSLRVSAATAAHDKDINSVAVSPNDTLVATGSQDKTARVWKLPNLTPHLVLKGHKRGVWSVEFSPTDQALITASGDRTIKMWSIADGGTCLRTFEGHQASVLRASFITGGTQILSAGADGLVKLWSLRSDECVSTFDEHEGKVWAMASGGEGDALLITGGSDAKVVVWADCTAADAREAEEEEERLVGREQSLANALAAGDFVTAARLAFDLRHPGRLLAVVQRAAAAAAGAAPLTLAMTGASGSGVLAGEHTSRLLAELVQQMSESDVRTALEYCREWNTNSRHCHAAQAMLGAMLRHRKPTQLLTLPGIGQLLDGLLAYSGRHFARVDRLQRATRILDYTLGRLAVLNPEGVEEDVEATAAGGSTLRTSTQAMLIEASHSHGSDSHMLGRAIQLAGAKRGVQEVTSDEGEETEGDEGNNGHMMSNSSGEDMSS